MEMFYWWLAPIAVGVLGVLFVAGGLASFFRGEPASGSRRVVGGTTVAAIGFALSLVGLNIQLFSQLTHEGPVAEVQVTAVDPAKSMYRVTVHRLDGKIPDQNCTLQGDEWLISGRVQKWKAWANVLGLDATYTLDQLSNMYFTAERGNGKPITACDLTGKPQANDYVPEAWRSWLLAQFYTVDRKFGDANYMPLADGAVYRVVITQSGFNSEPANDIAIKANNARP
jgi:hypothetical protein